MIDPDLEERLELLRRAADRAATVPDFMAYVLAQWGEAEGLTWRQVAERLGCADHTVHRLALCRRPDPSPERFACDVQRVASYVDIDPDALAQVVRQTDALQALRQARPAADSDAAAVGFLMAALDRLENAASKDSSEGDDG